MVEEPERPPEKPSPAVSLARYSEIGFIVPAAVFLGFGLGKLLDYWLGTKWIFIPGVIFGAVAGFADMIRRAMAAARDKS